jgi:hypothetical protein
MISRQATPSSSPSAIFRGGDQKTPPERQNLQTGSYQQGHHPPPISYNLLQVIYGHFCGIEPDEELLSFVKFRKPPLYASSGAIGNL